MYQQNFKTNFCCLKNKLSKIYPKIKRYKYSAGTEHFFPVNSREFPFHLLREFT